MANKVAAIALAISVLAAPAYAAQARKKPEPPPPPPQFHVDVATRTMSLERLALSIPASAKVGEVAVESLTCSFNKVPLLVGDAFKNVPQKDLAQVFAAEAALAGYRLAQSQTDLFSSGEASHSELLIGAAILDLTEKGCIQFSTSMDATIKVEWQVYDPLEKKILFRGTSDGTTKVRGDTGDSAAAVVALASDATRSAFQQAAKAILADPNFVAAVRDPKGGTPPEAGTLFPEAQPSVPAAAAPVQIIRLPLSAKPFKDQVAQLRNQVVTVITPQFTGSAFYIADGLLLTNHHVIEGYTHLRLRFYGGREIDAEVVTSNAKRDIALIRSASAGVAGLPLRLEAPEIAAPVFVIGSPLGKENEGSVSAGIVSALRDEKEGSFIQSDVGVTHGNSGGPMFDDKGNVVALVDKGFEGTAVNRFIPITDALKVLDIRFAP